MTATRRHLLLFAALFLLAWLPRGFALNRFVTSDERKWLARSANFYQALTYGDYAHTFQREHPGVMIMWAGTAGFLWRYPEYPREAPGQFGWKDEEVEPFLREHGHEPLELLTAGRVFVVLGIAAALAGAFLMAVRLVGLWPALTGFALIAFDPFHVALSRLLHLDGLVSSLMLLSLLAFLSYLLRGRRRLDLVVSACAAGRGWLTKSPAFFLIPFVGLLVLVELWSSRQRTAGAALYQLGISGWRSPAMERAPLRLPLAGPFVPLVAWGVIAAFTFVLLWPAMWVDPVGSLSRVFDEAEAYASEGHLNPRYFDGRIVEGDPGPHFYPIAYLWRTTPIVLAGVVLALVAYVTRRPPFVEATQRRVALALVLFVALFTLFMTLGAKKFDRYLLPVFAPLDLLAGMGWVAAASWLRALLERRRRTEDGGGSTPKTSEVSETSEVFSPAATRAQLTRDHGPLPSGGRRSAVSRLSIAVLGLAVAVQALSALPTFPYYFSYYNPLLGGSKKAPEVMMIGWGEGMDLVAEYLNAKPGAEQLRVMSWEGPFSYFFKGHTTQVGYRPTMTHILRWLSNDYMVVYANEWQRDLPTHELQSYFGQQTPEHVVWIDGLEYARVYDVRDAPPPDFLAINRPRFADWGDLIRLVAYRVPETPVMPGQEALMTFYLQSLGPIDRDLNVLVRLVGADGQEWARHEGWPWGTPTSTWKPRELWPDGHELAIPAEAPPGYYRIELSFYDPATLAKLPATDPRTRAPIGETLVVDYLTVSEPAVVPAQAGGVNADLGGQVRLLGVEVQTSNGQPVGSGAAVAAGSQLQVRLFWQAQALLETDYTVFVHLVGANGELVAQRDQLPTGGFFPTSYWLVDQIVPDTHTLVLGADVPPGSYELRVGMYDLATTTRLPVTGGAEAGADFVRVATVEVE
ncbi:MAG TPA: glycosyltransferase family 39 protein [Ardenticatenaceae bacterium]|nr:glycosyltransferase family 39 protein [Ardenticatenaceae bacterium]